MRRIHWLSKLKPRNKGQSFVELAIVFLTIFGLFVGMVEFGNVLNQYIGLVDGAREGARLAANLDPFLTGTINPNITGFYQRIDEQIEGIPPDAFGNGKVSGALDPLQLDPNNDHTSDNPTYLGDDIVISVYSVNDDGTIQAYSPWSKYNNQTPHVDQAAIQTQLNAHPAPGTGIVVVEIFYHYNQILQMIPYPINVHAYAIMPLTAAEPTPTPSSP